MYLHFKTETMKTYQASGKEIQLYNFTGIVAETGKNMETIVSGGGGGGYSYQGTGGTAPVSIRSRTVVHDQFFLVDAKGNEMSFQLQDFNIACRRDNKLTVIWGIKKGKDKGPYIIVHNHSTNSTFYDDKSMARLFRLSPLLLFGGGLLAIIILWNIIGGWILAIAIGGLIYYEITLRKQIKAFKNSIDFTEFA